jgi:hypothetical protein
MKLEATGNKDCRRIVDDLGRVVALVERYCNGLWGVHAIHGDERMGGRFNTPAKALAWFREQGGIKKLPADYYPPLDSPALVGNTKFDTGVSSKLVVEAAQRNYQYSQRHPVPDAGVAELRASIEALSSDK